jgi:glycine cleavage system aminomethyltransferase T
MKGLTGACFALTSVSIVDFSPQRRSPFHQLLAERGAVLDGTSHWRYPMWFASNSHPDRWDAIRHEQFLVRQRVGVFDGSCLSQIVVAGPDSLRLLNQLSTREMDVKPGTATYAQWCDDDGRMLLDAIVTRCAMDRFEIAVNDTLQKTTMTLATSMAAQIDAEAVMFDNTSAVASLIVSGPLARNVLQKLTTESLHTDTFPPMRASVVELAGVPLTMSRISYMGELTFELHIPTEYGWSVASEVLACVEADGGGPVGLEAVYALGTEHGMLDFDYSIDNTLTPLEAGLDRGIAWDKPEGFRGLDALRRQRQSNLERRMAFVHIPLSHDCRDLVMAPGDQLLRDGAQVASLITVDQCHAVDREVAAACLVSREGITRQWIERGAWEVVSNNSTVPVAVTTSALYDPQRTRSRS